MITPPKQVLDSSAFSTRRTPSPVLVCFSEYLSSRSKSTSPTLSSIPSRWISSLNSRLHSGISCETRFLSRTRHLDIERITWQRLLAQAFWWGLQWWAPLVAFCSCSRLYKFHWWVSSRHTLISPASFWIWNYVLVTSIHLFHARLVDFATLGDTTKGCTVLVLFIELLMEDLLAIWDHSKLFFLILF